MVNVDVLKIKDLSFAYTKEKETIKKVSFSIEEGKYVSIIGHNGSGKSTIAKLILGLLDKKSGSIQIFDMELNEKTVGSIRQLVGIVFQNPDNQFIGATVRDDIAFGLENRQVPHADMDSIIDEFAKTVNMEEFLDKEPSSLSGGQKQRVAIAGVLAMHPKMIIFDEATAMLDPKGKREIREIIHKMKEDNPNLTILSITHDLEEAYASDEVIVVNDGTIYMQGTPEEVFKHEEELKAIELDLPFLAKVKDALNKQEINVGKISSIEELVNKLCQ